MTAGMLRTEAVVELAKVRGGMLSIVAMQATPPWIALGQADERNVNLLGSMGSAPAIALGLAIALPDEPILVLDGDGSLLMQLGSLVSIGELQPRRLYHVVFENGTYETSGGQPVPGRGRADLCAIALASGYRHAVRYTTVEEMADLPRALELDGPVLISLLISGQGDVSTMPGANVPATPPPDFGTQLENMRVALARAGSPAGGLR